MNIKPIIDLAEYDYAANAIETCKKGLRTKFECPLCGADLVIYIGQSGDEAKCSRCEFKVTFRGI